MSSSFFTQQAMKNMMPMLYENHKIEVFASVTSLIWILSGIFPNAMFYVFSLTITMIITTFLGIMSVLPNNRYNYSANAIAFRRLIAGAFAHWTYTAGGAIGPEILDLEGLIIPVIQISQYTLLGLLIIWFSTKSYDQLQDPNISSVMYPFIVVRGILRATMLTALVYALFSKNLVPTELTFPYLFVIYIAEPFVYGFAQMMNPTLSRFEHTLGNARLPSVALRESFVSNFFILAFTTLWGGVSGSLWQLLLVSYLFAGLFVFFYSLDAVKEFQKNPLGKNPISDFFQQTPDILKTIDLNNAVGHVVNESTMMDLSKKSGLNLDAGSIVIPLEQVKGNVNALIIGKGQSIIKSGDQKIGEAIDGVSTVLIPKKQFKQISSKYIAKKMSQIDLDELELPSMEQLQQYVGLLSTHFGSFVEKLITQMNSIDLSNYGITESKGRTDVKLPGIEVHETPDLTSVKFGGFRVLDAKGATTVRLGNVLTVVDLPKASFVSLPGITIVDIAGEGSLVNLFGFNISDGLPPAKLDEIRASVFAQLDRWEMAIDAELGRYLADRSATGLLSVGWDGEFNLLLDSKTKTMGNHIALEAATNKDKGMHYLPPNFDEMVKESTEKDREFQQLTGLDPTPALNPARDKPSKENTKSLPEYEVVKENDTGNDADDFVIIHDVDVEEDEHS